MASKAQKRLFKRDFKNNAARRHPIYFEGKVVGTLNDPNIDNYWMFGTWTPILGKHYDSFLDTIRTTEEGKVIIGNNSPPQKGIVRTVPDDTIEINIALSW